MAPSFKDLHSPIFFFFLAFIVHVVPYSSSRLDFVSLVYPLAFASFLLGVALPLPFEPSSFWSLQVTPKGVPFEERVVWKILLNTNES